MDKNAIITELEAVLRALGEVQVDGRFWHTMLACSNSIKQVLDAITNETGDDEK